MPLVVGAHLVESRFVRVGQIPELFEKCAGVFDGGEILMNMRVGVGQALVVEEAVDLVGLGGRQLPEGGVFP